MRNLLWAVAAVVATAAFSGRADATFISFDADLIGPKLNPFTSVDSNQVTFTDSMGMDLVVADFDITKAGNELLIQGDDASMLVMNFTSLNTNLSLAFGNDPPSTPPNGNIALLTLFNGATQVGQVSVVMNQNNLVDQTISYSGAAFDSATLVFATPGGTPVGLTEVVDDISFDATAPNAVPAPAGLVLGLIGLGSAGVGGLARRRRAVAA